MSPQNWVLFDRIVPRSPKTELGAITFLVLCIFDSRIVPPILAFVFPQNWTRKNYYNIFCVFFDSRIVLSYPFLNVGLKSALPLHYVGLHKFGRLTCFSNFCSSFFHIFFVVCRLLYIFFFFFWQCSYILDRVKIMLIMIHGWKLPLIPFLGNLFTQT